MPRSKLDKKVSKIAKAFDNLYNEIDEYLNGDIHNTKSWDKNLKELFSELQHYGGLFEP